MILCVALAGHVMWHSGHVTTCGPQVVLELENIEEEDELEELEDGKVGGGEGGVEETDGAEEGEEVVGGEGLVSGASSGRATPIGSAGVGMEPPQGSRCRKGLLPVFPYYGCESFECHLLCEKRPHAELRLDHVSTIVAPNDVMMM